MIRFGSIALSVIAGLVWYIASQSALAAPRPVVLELFTSNSCSSCPPAYTLLRRLQASPPEKNLNLIVLSEHVDYWNNLGWVDRYSDAQFTERQRSYARQVFGRGHVYTPQLVVDGRHDMVGSRAHEVRTAIDRAAGRADLPVALRLKSGDSQQVTLRITVASNRVTQPGQVWVALTQNDVVSHVGAGENGGRRLREDGVVRVLKPAGTVTAGDESPRHYDVSLRLPTGVAPNDLKVAAFVQRDDSRAIVGAAQMGLGSIE